MNQIEGPQDDAKSFSIFNQKFDLDVQWPIISLTWMKNWSFKENKQIMKVTPWTTRHSFNCHYKFHLKTFSTNLIFLKSQKTFFLFKLIAQRFLKLFVKDSIHAERLIFGVSNKIIRWMSQGVEIASKFWQMTTESSFKAIRFGFLLFDSFLQSF